jgi:hypothetical protein
MRKELLIATAVTALLAGTGFAGAQEKNQGHGGPAAAPHSAAPAPHAQAAPRPQAQSAPRGQMGHQASTPTRNAPTHMGQAQPNRMNTQERRGTNASAQTEKNRTQRNAQSERNRAQQNAQEERNRTERNTGAAQNERNRGNMGQENNRGTAQTEQSNRGRVSLSTEQRTKIRQTVLAQSGAPRVSRADLGGIDLRVGVAIPRDRIHFRLVPLPQTIVEIEPAWEGFLYFLVGDEVVVVDPTTYDVVAVLPA